MRTDCVGRLNDSDHLVAGVILPLKKRDVGELVCIAMLFAFYSSVGSVSTIITFRAVSNALLMSSGFIVMLN